MNTNTPDLAETKPEELFAAQIDTLAHTMRQPDRASSVGDPVGDEASTQVYEWDERPDPGENRKPYLLRVTVETIPVKEEAKLG